MKRILFLFLAAAMLLSAISCSSQAIVLSETKEDTNEKISLSETEESSDKELRESDGVFAVGFGKESITPGGATPLAGYANDNQRLSTKVLDKVYATCIALKDVDGNIALIYTLDMLSTPDSFAQKALDAVSKETGISQDNIIFSATHTHEGPSPNTEDPASTKWRTIFIKAIKTAAKTAISDLDKSEIYIGTTKCENMNFVRRYITAEGGFLGDNYGSGTPVAHETEADQNMGIIKFDRKNAKDIVLINWAAHPSINGGSEKTDVSADYPTYLRKTVEKEADVLCAFYEGAAGNLNIGGRLEGEKPYTSANEYGKALAKKALAAIPKLEKADSGTIKSKVSAVTLTVDHSKDNLLQKANEVRSLFSAGDKDGANALAKSYGFDSCYTANHIYNKANAGATKDVKIWAISCGDIAFAGAPYEMFTENGRAIKEGSDFKLTFVCEQANGGNSYIPSAIACKNGGYEVTACTFVPGTAEILQNAFIESLNSIK